jgi:hypothetical protein
MNPAAMMDTSPLAPALAAAGHVEHHIHPASTISTHLPRQNASSRKQQGDGQRSGAMNKNTLLAKETESNGGVPRVTGSGHASH